MQTPKDPKIAFAKMVVQNCRFALDNVFRTTSVQCATIALPSFYHPQPMQNRLVKNNMHHPELLMAFLALCREGMKNCSVQESDVLRTNKVHGLANDFLKEKKREKDNLVEKLKAQKKVYKETLPQNKLGSDAKPSIVAIETIEISPTLFYYWAQFSNGAQCGMALYSSLSSSSNVHMPLDVGNSKKLMESHPFAGEMWLKYLTFITRMDEKTPFSMDEKLHRYPKHVWDNDELRELVEKYLEAEDSSYYANLSAYGI